MAVKNIIPTKTNLLKIKQELRFAQLGYELLDQKRNILINELLNLVDQTISLEEKVENALLLAYQTLEKAVLNMGKLKSTVITNAVNIEAQFTLNYRKVMGVTLPIIKTDFKDNSPYFSPYGTSIWIESSISEFKKALELMGKLAELKISIMRLALEVKKTIRKVNALEKIAIPELIQSVQFIQNRLEENEREMFVLMKVVKTRLENKSKIKK